MISAEPVVLNTEFPGIPLTNRGKVRDLYDLGDRLLLVATDRISAFDVILPTGIPGKGRVLTQLSAWWFKQMEGVVPHHVLSTKVDDLPVPFQAHRPTLEGRIMIAKKVKSLPVECIVRGYLSGSGWSEYQKQGTVCGQALPKGLTESAKLDQPIFTPSTKATEGHDENISFEKMTEILKDKKLADQVREISLKVYRRACELAEPKGIIIADTKMELGWDGEKLIVIDELLTPDSSRFWPKDQYQAGKAQPSYDKQFVRDYLVSIKWNKQPPAPVLPEEIARKTSEKYQEALTRLTA